MPGRLAWYAGASMALAAGVVASAFQQRANFYSAMVHLAQSSLSLMILVNLAFLIYGSFFYGLQRLCFGPLRPVEIEQLYEKSWYAVTETCLAMTVFREEVGASFLVMFTALVSGKIWGWISDGRVEILEQQPPTNPRLFHTRLSLSLCLSIVYDVWLLTYAINTVYRQARPTLMVMFLFEFAVLSVGSLHTAARYLISLYEARTIKKQTEKRLEDRRRAVREQRAEILRRRETEGVTQADADTNGPLPSEDDIDEMDIEVPGWEAKGLWTLGLDLTADFLKLAILMIFFCILMTFYGLPIHIMRDLFMTLRSFIKRMTALLRYQQALKDMNRYPDATAEELGREDTCIICREEMQPWDTANPGQVERSRPKKLPCGHILHFGCLKSWLERQQVCPTCRRSVVMDVPAQARNRNPLLLRLGMNGNNQQNQQAPANAPAAGGIPGAPPINGPRHNGQNGQGNGRNGGGFRLNLGPIRLIFAQGGVQDLEGAAEQLGLPPRPDGRNPPLAAAPGLAAAAPGRDQDTDTPALLTDIRAQLSDVRQRVINATERVERDVRGLRDAEAQLVTLTLLLQEMTRLNQLQQLGVSQPQPQQQPPPQPGQPGQEQQQDGVMAASQAPMPEVPPQNGTAEQTQGVAQGDGTRLLRPHIHNYPPPQAPRPPQLFPYNPQPSFNPFPAVRHGMPAVTRHGGAPLSAAIPAGSPELPEGVVIPPGWSLLPLHRLDNRAGPYVGAIPPGQAPSAPRTAGRSLSATRAPASETYGEFALFRGREFDDGASSPAVSASTPPPPPTNAADPVLAAQEAATNTANDGAPHGSSTRQEPRGRGESAALDVQGGERDPDVDVAASLPTRSPNRAGPAQLFSTSSSRPAASDSNGDPQGQQSSSDSPEAKVCGNAGSDLTTSIPEEKGKAKAVTIEDGENGSEDET